MNNVFNDPKKRAATKAEIAQYFAVDDRPVLVRLKEWLGVNQRPEDQEKQNMQPVMYSPWERMQGEKK